MPDEGNDPMFIAGSFNPMLGGGDAVGVSGGGVGGESDEGLGGVFDIEGNKVVRCALVFGRQWLTCDGTELEILGADKVPAGVIYAEIDHSSTSLTLAVKHDPNGTLPENTLQKSYRALYYAYGVKGDGDFMIWSWADVRFQPAMFAMN